MLPYIAKRLLLFIPTLFLVSCLAFFLKNSVPSDPVETLLNLQGVDDSMENFTKLYDEKRTELGMDKPYFYFGVDANYKTWVSAFEGSSSEKTFANELSKNKFKESDIRSLISSISTLDDLSKRRLIQCQSPKEILNSLNGLQFSAISRSKTEPISNIATEMEHNKVSWHYPVLRWNGTDNQYNRWMKSMLSGDFGVSLTDTRPVFDKIWGSLRWTLVLLFFSLILVLVLSFGLGVYNGTHQGSRFDVWSNSLLFLWYSIPKFWLATMMIIFFTTAEYGGWTNIFPVVGRWGSTSDGFLTMIFNSLDKFILPVLVIIVPDVAYLSRLIRASVIEENKKEYINTARSKGVSQPRIVWKHLIPNSLTSTITLMAGVIPSAIGSSLIIEVIFNIPGIGRLMYESIRTADWAVVFPIVFIISIVTVITFLLADIMIAWLNPKIELE